MKLRLKIIAVAFVTLFVSSSFAGFRVGGIIGPRLNSNTGALSNVNFDSSNFAYHLGAIGIIDFFGVGIRTGLIYTSRDLTGSTSSSIPFVSQNFTQNLKYFDIPANVVLFLPITDLYVFGGLKFGFKASGGIPAAYSGFVSSNIETETLNMLFNVGVGYDFIDLGLFTISGELEYEHGITKVYNTGSIRSQGFILNALATVGF